MKKYILVLASLCLATTFSAYAQTSEPAKGKLQLAVGTQYRITPIWFNASSINNQRPANFSADPHLSGAGISYEIRYLTRNEKVTFGFRHSVRYDYALTEQEATPNVGGTLLKGPSNAIFQDYQGFVNFPLFKRDQKAFGLELVLGLMNRGPQITIEEYSPGAELEYNRQTTNYNFSTSTVGFSYIHGRTQINLRNHLTNNMDPIRWSNTGLWLIELGITYRVLNLI